jgi:3-deoxy-D-manno-octulosonic-acid transferase
MASLLWLLYQAGLALALLIAGPFLLVRRGKHYLPTLSGRMGGGSGPPPAGVSGRPLWLHAVSVGEVGVAATLARALPAAVPLVVTTVTPTGQALAQRLFAGRAQVAYLPFDLRPTLGRFWRRFTPAALVLVEGDYWPLLLRQASRRGLPVAVVNGRVGDRGFRRLRLLRPVTRLFFGNVQRFGMQTTEDRARLERLGVEPARLAVTGNLKFDTPEPPIGPELRALIAACEQLAAGRPLLIAGSTMAGEDEQVLAAFQALGGGQRALLVLAPRHPERWGDVERLLRQGGLTALRRTSLATAPAGASPTGVAWSPANQAAWLPEQDLAPRATRTDVLLLDTVGELAALYSAGAAAFIGGTLVPTGGHNPIEPARYRLPIAVGPSMHNFRDVAARFDAAGAWQRVTGPDDLAAAWRNWLDHPATARAQGEKAAALLAENRGAILRTLDLLAPLLATLHPPPPSGTAAPVDYAPHPAAAPALPAPAVGARTDG